MHLTEQEGGLQFLSRSADETLASSADTRRKRIVHNSLPVGSSVFRFPQESSEIADHFPVK